MMCIAYGVDLFYIYKLFVVANFYLVIYATVSHSKMGKRARFSHGIVSSYATETKMGGTDG